MLKRIRSFLEDRRTKSKINKIIRLLYSEQKFETADDFIKTLQLKSEFEKLEYYILIEIAAKLDRPFKDEYLTQIYEGQVKAFECFLASTELREAILELEMAKANISLIHFNYRMDNLRSALEFSIWSPGGMKLRKLLAKGGPLTEKEKNEVEKAYKEIKRLDDLEKATFKELENAAKNNP